MQVLVVIILVLAVGGLFFARYLQMKNNPDDALAVALVSGVLVLGAMSGLR